MNIGIRTHLHSDCAATFRPRVSVLAMTCRAGLRHDVGAGGISAAASPAPSMVTSVAGTHLTSFDAQMITLINKARRARRRVSGRRSGRPGLDQLALWWSGQLNAGGKTSYNLPAQPERLDGRC